MTCLLQLNPVPKMTAVHAARAVMLALVLTVPHLAARVVRQWAATLRLPMAATNLLRLLEPMRKTPPLSASARQSRQLQQLTAKENNYVATRSSQISQRAKGP
jgi:hypothetical protein